MTTQTDPWLDQRRRFVPSKTAVGAAVAALADHPDADAAVVPLYMPGKSYGNWTVGQPVEVVELTGNDVLIGTDNHDPTRAVPAVRDMITRAFELAAARLADHAGGGTTAYAIVRRDGTCMVFEEFRSTVT